MNVTFPESRNLGVSLFFPALGFTFISFFAVKDATGSLVLAGLAAFVSILFFFFLWRGIFRSITLGGSDVFFETNGGTKKVSLTDGHRISVIRGPLSRSVLIIARGQGSWIGSVLWSAFEQSSIGDYEATIREIQVGLTRV